MAVNGKFMLTGEQFSPLMLYGFGNYMAFSFLVMAFIETGLYALQLPETARCL